MAEIIDKDVSRVIIAEDDDIRIIRLELGQFQTNAYIIVCKATGSSLLIDAPADADEISRQLKHTNPRYIAITHNHFDHIGVLDEMISRLQVPVAMHHMDAVDLQLSVDINLNDGDHLTIGRIKIKVLHTPGHTGGSLCFLTGRYLLAGDTIFPGGPGHTSTPGNFKQIIKAIQNKIMVLPGDVVIYPGHGESTALGTEKKAFAAFTSGKYATDLCGDVIWSAV